VIERTHVLEDLHWADRSTLDLIAFPAHNLGENRVLLVGAYRGDELPLEHRLRRLVTGLLRAGAATRLELGPLGREDLETLLLTRGGAPLSPALTEAIVTRSEAIPSLPRSYWPAPTRMAWTCRMSYGTCYSGASRSWTA
jgi:predicted ATPase